ncbi:DNA-binding response regulator [Chitinophaga caeni]|uniref:DNA-binding response regulator n=1 Tax=Chitinophaga caeni TaxID=2029983 RepID=A0A291QWF9_9BACT|nr:response regulator transcription factor [Chitinophaga caeni]ATL48275.1 DNA-binding response regulator [Chitinophaga caeni]
MKILIIEDETELGKSILDYLEEEKYTCELAYDYRSALDKIGSFDYDCILLDITLPGGSGLNILKELKRDRKDDGVIIISAKNSLDDKIAGLQLGADDYLAKPFHLSELGARVAAVIRRRQFSGSNQLAFNELVIDTMAKTVKVNEQLVELTRKEYGLLLYLVANQNRVVSKNAIAENLAGEEVDAFDNYDFIYAHIKNLKRKLTAAGCEDYIKSIYGMGYKFSAS